MPTTCCCGLHTAQDRLGGWCGGQRGHGHKDCAKHDPSASQGGVRNTIASVVLTSIINKTMELDVCRALLVLDKQSYNGVNDAI